MLHFAGGVLNVFSPVSLGPLTLRNRIVKAATAVSPEGRTHRDQVFIREAAMPGLRRLAEAVEAEGATVAPQIGHAGPVANGRSNGAQAIAPTRMPSPLSMHSR